MYWKLYICMLHCIYIIFWDCLFSFHSFRFLFSRSVSCWTLLHFAFLLQTPCFSAATARTAPPCGAGASPQDDAKERPKSLKLVSKYHGLSLIILDYL